MYTNNNFYSFVTSPSKWLLAAFALTLASPALSTATPLASALTQIQDTSFITPQLSTDLPYPFYDVFPALQALTGTTFFRVGTFNGFNASTFQFTSLFGVTFYDGHHPGYGTDVFGIFDSQGTFHPALSLGAGVGASATVSFTDNNPFTFGLSSPDGLYSTIDSQNPDLSTHAIAMSVIQDGTVSYSGNASLFGASSSFDLHVGDIVVLWEDLIHLGADNDYNDYAIVIHDATAVPEPSTVALMALSLLGLAALRRRNLNGSASF